jgi:hypothetical protein
LACGDHRPSATPSTFRPTGRRAGAGEILVCVDTATAVRLDPTLDRTRLKLKTKAPANEVVTCA